MAHRMGFDEALQGPVAAAGNSVISPVDAANSDAMSRTLIPPGRVRACA